MKREKDKIIFNSNFHFHFHSAIIIQTRQQKSLPLFLGAYLLWTKSPFRRRSVHAFPKNCRYTGWRVSLCGLACACMKLVASTFFEHCCTTYIWWLLYQVHSTTLQRLSVQSNNNSLSLSRSRLVCGSILRMKKETRRKVLSFRSYTHA